MTEIILYLLAALTLPVSALLVVQYVIGTFDRDLSRENAERLESRRKAAG